MVSFLALMRREALEHRFAYVFAPLGLLALIGLISVYVWLSVPDLTGLDVPIPSAQKLYELAYAAAVQGWWIYALISLFFYCADAFHGDVRNNGMLFWKSMPQSDFTIAASKLVTALTLFPFIIFLAAVVTGLVLILPAGAAASGLAASTALDPGAALGSFVTLSGIALVYFALGLLWYAPFFAWVGLLGTILGRWCIPIAVLIPVVAVVFELLVIRPQGAPDGSYLLSFLSYRTAYGFGGYNLELTLLLANPIDLVSVAGDMLANFDWVTVVGGLGVALALLFAGAEYRRRVLLT